MSYILDALKKSDQRRKLGKVPDLQTDHSASVYDGTPRRFWRFLGLLLVGVLAVNIGLWWWWGPLGEKGDDSSAPEGLAREAMPSSAGQGVPAAGGEEVAPPLPLSVQTSDSRPAVAGQALDEEGPSAPSASASADRLLPNDASEDAAREVQNVGEGQGEADGAAPFVVTPADDEISEVVKPEVVALADLPDDIRAALPEIRISLHFFSNEPRSRLARINDRHVREGEIVADGLRLLEITRDGVVFAFRGFRFRMDKF